MAAEFGAASDALSHRDASIRELYDRLTHCLAWGAARIQGAKDARVAREALRGWRCAPPAGWEPPTACRRPSSPARR